MKKVLSVAAIVAAAISVNANADDKQDLIQLRKTVSTLVETMIEKGLLTKEQGDALVRDTVEQVTTETVPPITAETGTPVDKSVVRVPYVPEIVKEELRQQLREELRKDVADDVILHARKKRWGVPGSWPNWVDRITFSGDFRLRGQRDDFADDNALYPNIQAMNDKRSSAIDNPFLNTTEDRDRLRARLRLGLDALVTEGVNIGARLASGSLGDPVSTNQTLGNTSRPYQLVLDQAYLRYRSQQELVTFWGGRMPNPWYGTDLVWDEDLNFEGMATRFKIPRLSGDLLGFDPFLTLGAFPLQEVELSSADKWLYGMQVGFDWRVGELSMFKFGLSRYSYRNIAGKRNELASRENDFTAPQFVQKGNSVFSINNDVGSPPGQPPYGLASDFDEVNLTTSLDVASFAPTHIIFTFDYVKNIGFDQKQILKRTGTLFDENTTGMQLSLLVGRPKLEKAGEWQIIATHKHLEADAVLDAYTDSDFHLGGTDAQGWTLGGGYAFKDNAWLNLRYLTSDAIDGPPLSVDTVQLDLNARF